MIGKAIGDEKLAIGRFPEARELLERVSFSGEFLEQVPAYQLID